MKHVISLSIAMGLLLFETDAYAQTLSTTRSVSRVQWNMGDWSFVPTLSGSGARVETILALRTSGAVTGANVVGVWVRRGRNTWKVFAWSEQDPAKLVAYVKQDLGIADRWDQSWPVAPASTAAPAPVGFANGVFESDPIRLSIESAADPRAEVENLVAAGWPAALIEFEIADVAKDCSEVELFELYAESVELELAAAPGAEGVGVDHLAAGLQSLPCLGWLFCWDHDVTVSGPTLVGCTVTTPWTLSFRPLLDRWRSVRHGLLV